MSTASRRYAPPSEAEVRRLVSEHPLAWIVSQTNDWRATPLPLRAERIDDDGRIQTLIGHVARRNPHADLLKAESRILLLFMGVNGYISPSWFTDRTQAPTWNYASIQYLCDVELLEAESSRDAVLADAVAAMEAGRSREWRASEMGARYPILASRVLAFRAHVVERRAIFKLGQDERDDVYREITAALADEGREELLAWMERANPSRR